jgi:hypothetical protein
MPRAYVDVSKFRTPFNYPNLTLTGLGSEPLRKNWPAGRSYVDTSRYRSPYIDYQFQDNTLFGLGDALSSQPLPPAMQAYIQTGAPMSTLRRDLGSALAQVPRVAWGAGALVAGYLAYRAWKAPQQ